MALIRRSTVLCVCVGMIGMSAVAVADDVVAPHRSDAFVPEMAFEAAPAGDAPAGWGGGPAETITVDGTVVHAGARAARIDRAADRGDTFTALTRAIPVDFAGTELVLTGWVKTRDVVETAGLWMRVDGPSGPIAFDNMQDRAITGTTDWTACRIVLTLPEAGTDVYLGGLLAGAGTAWFDDLALTLDGVPIGETEVAVTEPTAIDLDTAFDDGSGVTVTALTDAQVASLDLLGRVWGFLKYHHPAVTGGEHHWDYALFRVLPAMLDAHDLAEATRVVRTWADTTLGVPAPCDPCATLPDDVALAPDLAWIDALGTTDRGAELEAYLDTVYARRHPGGDQFHVTLHPNIRNPLFESEPAYPDLSEDDAGHRILALYRYWNIIQYWFPYRDVIPGDWNAVLPEFLPRFVSASTDADYLLALHALVTRVHDTHTNVWSDIQGRPPVGTCRAGAAIRWVEDQAVVFDVNEGVPLERGDVITAVDGVPVPELLAAWSPYYSASNEPTRHRDMMRALTRGECGEVTLSVRGEDGMREVTAMREDGVEVRRWHDRPGDAFQLLSDDIAYLTLGAALQRESPGYVARAAGTRGMVIDIRNYPNEFMVFWLGMRLIDRPSTFVVFTSGDLANPGAFGWGEPITLTPADDRYEGRVAILVDEISQSQSEYTTMAFRTAPGALVVGSTTAGADGNASWFRLPGAKRSMISGLGVFYPDRTPTQRVGILPDVEVRPTVAGIRAGRDEVLEAAIRELLGPDADEDEIRRMAARR